MEQVVVGVVTKPQALKGEFRVKSSILNMKQFKKFNSVFISGREYKIEKVTLRDSFVILKVVGVDSCESAEMFRNLDVYAEMELDTSDSFDLVGFEVFVGNSSLGRIVEINNYGSKDIISVQGKNAFMMPMIDDLVLDIDENEKAIKLNPESFEQVVVYEN